MDIDGTTAVVTGGGSGIGAALAEAFAAAGARVVVADLDESGAAGTAGRIRAAGGDAVAVRADASATTDIEALTRTELGPVDIYVANAGIIGVSGLGTDADWDRILAVNLRAHVRAADILVPQWVSRGRGYFVSVASAAGLLSQIGAAGYAVTKHAAVGFAEWLAITHGDDGIGVSCVCPLGVDTPLLHAVRNSSESDALVGAESIVRSGDVITPEDVATVTVDAVRAGRFLVLPHPHVLDLYRRKGSDYDRWIAGMRRYQRSLGGGTVTGA
ncbi:SDR family NAD(P)-dependent oxidoreductase [Mycolicibacterium goodii]|uniref:SDR family NAD(P)-dependent oxidoreductase n=1 Tax=Mycolicibacterium goodii TaxID=134601 RepID=A0ABS6HID1_MYCGD|nr:SDR family NAD(P)-dependent oxidoreductase [Mycolicibacterium goodii]OKH72222.1 dehydrogenase [Mycobacterium sp. SWH-M5]MBU8810040.1 SDR family NAD(P)-dependent oxidoreductase [Mycolicibacterium goodii]MBU8822003.1 SDR family NAD(P)-dependent oxidoreductase [Mycolicibacterium goodii]MBU8838783.1 SDR family NAD(P)-dependent oxidoreductase [Mycolicibacterium goodii]ULN49305.1 SDR family NAD(P)-dependent oxidoreductase [Mycolicibacterium goodii]